MAENLNIEVLTKLDMLIKLQALSMVGRFESFKGKDSVS